jgi:dTDP-4-amino-4,6-dideoxy-D-galactose acyltransferase
MEGQVCEFLPWDTQHFGRRVGKVLGHTLDEARLRAALEWARSERIECLYFLADASDVPTTKLAEASGFVNRDLSVTYRHMRDTAIAPGRFELPPGFAIREAVEEDLPVLEGIAAGTFQESRFHADEGFGREAVRDMYRIWVRNGVRTVSTVALTLTQGGATVGFILARLSARGEGVLELSATAPGLRGQGFGLALYSAARTELYARGASSVLGTTQVHNVKCQRTLQRLGFLLESVRIWYHRWAAPVARAA